MPIEEVIIKLPYFDIVSVKWAPNTNEREAAWQLFVEFSTRITSIKRELGPEGDFGSARLAMNSLYNLMDTSRKILREAGPSIAKKTESLGPITIYVLNQSIRKILDDYHTKLEAFESLREPHIDRVKHEREWPLYENFWHQMVDMQEGIREFTKALEEIAGVKSYSKDN